MKKLVIVESPAKVKTISKYLGANYIVKASMGHIVDLPSNELAVDTLKKYEPKYVVTKNKVIKELRSKLDGVDTLIIATDPDREGEAIGWHVAQRLKVIDKRGKQKDKDRKIERIVFTSITKDAIEDAIKKTRKIDMNLVDAQQARRVLDRLVGYKLSPLIWQKIRYGLSAGRVQSVAVRLIVDRERERDAFDPEEFWNITADVSEKKSKKKLETIIILNEKKDDNDDESDEKIEYQFIKFILDKIDGKAAKISDQKTSYQIIQKIGEKPWIVEKIEKKNSFRNPQAPFITSTLQQASANKFGYSAKKTMSIAQKLYEQGFITYMRTDSPTITSSEVTKIRSYIKKTHGEKYLNEKVVEFKSKSKNAQEAHEAIRTTSHGKSSSDHKLQDEYAKLYDLIRSRTLASQMKSATIEVNSIFIQIDNYTFKAQGERLTFDGFLKVYPEKFAENALPELKEGQEIYPDKIFGLQRFTKPPARYTEATLIKALEKFGVGRPSTYASIVSTILSRKYVEKEARYFFPTDTGKVVNRLLEKYFDNIVDHGFTAKMEDSLDDIADGKIDWIKVVDDFYKPFEKKVLDGTKNIKKDEFTVLAKAPKNIKCPVCKSSMVVKLSRFGTFYSCSKFPECKGMLDIDGKSDEQKQKETIERINSDEFKASYEPSPKTEDGKDYILKKGRFGEFWAHPDYPKKKDIKPLVLVKAKILEIYGEPPKTDDGKDYILKKGRFGEFWAHPDYPKIKDIKRISKKEN